jgi:accessory colonization factor AcfC
MLRTAQLFAVVLTFALVGTTRAAPETILVYGPGGPLPAIKEAAVSFSKARGIDVQVTAGPTSGWIDKAKQDADVIYSGSEAMMSEFVALMPDQIDSKAALPLYLRPAAILVRPGNPGRITGLRDLLKPGRRIVVVNESGQGGLWEDVAGRLGDIETVRAFRRNIALVARTSADAKQAWLSDTSLDAWLIWNIWQVANPTAADQVEIEPEYRIYRDTGVAVTKRGSGKEAAKAFADYLASPEAARIFAKWGWWTGRGH